jgi:hypothetical protein
MLAILGEIVYDIRKMKRNLARIWGIAFLLVTSSYVIFIPPMHATPFEASEKAAYA